MNPIVTLIWDAFTNEIGNKALQDLISIQDSGPCSIFFEPSTMQATPKEQMKMLRSRLSSLGFDITTTAPKDSGALVYFIDNEPVLPDYCDREFSKIQYLGNRMTSQVPKMTYDGNYHQPPARGFGVPNGGFDTLDKTHPANLTKTPNGISMPNPYQGNLAQRVFNSPVSRGIFASNEKSSKLRFVRNVTFSNEVSSAVTQEVWASALNYFKCKMELTEDYHKVTATAKAKTRLTDVIISKNGQTMLSSQTARMLDNFGIELEKFASQNEVSYDSIVRALKCDMMHKLLQTYNFDLNRIAYGNTYIRNQLNEISSAIESNSFGEVQGIFAENKQALKDYLCFVLLHDSDPFSHASQYQTYLDRGEQINWLTANADPVVEMNMLKTLSGFKQAKASTGDSHTSALIRLLNMGVRYNKKVK